MIGLPPPQFPSHPLFGTATGTTLSTGWGSPHIPDLLFSILNFFLLEVSIGTYIDP
ncbi:hypothetical protein BO83DRAFT_375497 [Aspergillus eucalypticola CBS 122712]|uniref:Uncharacterized protein n=1 Tax=Aspergillus eucalypticola (strain CBS 122712 / IBT 29274) TaxID=1448314 RepID=A0A317W6L1_ASPEC|nr:uncharacterized protein BO83DRAFT_375497 [Aspergillus eucalypticola CBS 122712]PWY81291.1 hypothetical protein BO83DRAFT_375497 [Aspergillus eucalypticola CBS 122712]